MGGFVYAHVLMGVRGEQPQRCLSVAPVFDGAIATFRFLMLSSDGYAVMHLRRVGLFSALALLSWACDGDIGDADVAAAGDQANSSGSGWDGARRVQRRYASM